MDETLERDPKEARKAARASLIGSTIENYDFLSYGTAAALYLGAAFFPGSDPVAATLATFAVFGVGFASRPIGAIIGGHLGDRLGRKFILITSLLVVGLATFGIGLLPTYEMVGVLAPILLVTLRLIQGIGHGFEWGGAVLMTTEHAAPERRGFFASFPQLGVPIGLLLANAAFLITAPLTGDWAWRLPFLMSAILVGYGLFLRVGIKESPEFVSVEEKGEIERYPVLTVLRNDWRNIVRIFGLRMAETGGFYLTTTFAVSYVHTNGLAESSTTLLAIVIASVIGLAGYPISGKLADRFGRKPIFYFGSIVAILIAFPMFLMLNTGSAVLIILALVTSLIFSHDPLFVTEGSWFPELFPAGVRSSGISLGYQGASVIGGFIPFIATGLFAAFSWTGPATLFALLGIISLVATFLTPETAPRKLSARAAAAESRESVSA
jgi:MFS transporter, MHS family, shikimate and dehydroshikimate transport protein